jgi:sugar O-acyltransferase (sialic acid O-acetyltransferase NeuD family)
MYLIGASGHAKVILDCLRDAGVKVMGLFDRNLMVKHLKSYTVFGDYSAAHTEEPLIVSIGDNAIRAKVVQQAGYKKFGKAIHPSALIADDVEIGEGTVVLHGAIIQSSSKIGKHVIINTSSVVDHDCVVGDYAHIAPKTALCGLVSVGEGTLIGVGTVVIPGVKIGKWCVIGAGSVVVKDIPDYAVAVGNPAKIIKYQQHET